MKLLITLCLMLVVNSVSLAEDYNTYKHRRETEDTYRMLKQQQEDQQKAANDQWWSRQQERSNQYTNRPLSLPTPIQVPKAQSSFCTVSPIYEGKTNRILDWEEICYK